MGDSYSVEFFDGPDELCGEYETDDVKYHESENGAIYTEPDESTFEETEMLKEIRDIFEEETGYLFFTKEELEWLLKRSIKPRFFILALLHFKC